MVFEAQLALWERQKEETNAAWAAFQVYRDLLPGDRNLLGAYRIAKGQEKANVCGTWRRWFEQYNWKKRAEAYDLHVDEKMRLELERQRIEARKETAELGKMLRRKAQEALSVFSGINEGVESKDGEEIHTAEPNLTPYQMARLASVGVALERLALGEPQTTTDVTSGGAKVHFFLPEKEGDGRDGDE